MMQDRSQGWRGAGRRKGRALTVPHLASSWSGVITSAR